MKGKGLSDHLDDKVRILVIGDQGVGKTSFLNGICKNKTSKDVRSTLGGSLEVKLHEYSPGRRFVIEFLEVSGNPVHGSIRSVFYSQFQGIILMFDTTNPQSLQNLWLWMREIRHAVNNANQSSKVPRPLMSNAAAGSSYSRSLQLSLRQSNMTLPTPVSRSTPTRKSSTSISKRSSSPFPVRVVPISTFLENSSDNDSPTALSSASSSSLSNLRSPPRSPARPTSTATDGLMDRLTSPGALFRSIRRNSSEATEKVLRQVGFEPISERQDSLQVPKEGTASPSTPNFPARKKKRIPSLTIEQSPLTHLSPTLRESPPLPLPPLSANSNNSPADLRFSRRGSLPLGGLMSTNGSGLLGANSFSTPLSATESLQMGSNGSISTGGSGLRTTPNSKSRKFSRAHSTNLAAAVLRLTPPTSGRSTPPISTPVRALFKAFSPLSLRDVSPVNPSPDSLSQTLSSPSQPTSSSEHSSKAHSPFSFDAPQAEFRTPTEPSAPLPSAASSGLITLMTDKKVAFSQQEQTPPSQTSATSAPSPPPPPHPTTNAFPTAKFPFKSPFRFPLLSFSNVTSLVGNVKVRNPRAGGAPTANHHYLAAASGRRGGGGAAGGGATAAGNGVGGPKGKKGRVARQYRKPVNEFKIPEEKQVPDFEGSPFSPLKLKSPYVRNQKTPLAKFMIQTRSPWKHHTPKAARLPPPPPPSSLFSSPFRTPKSPFHTPKRKPKTPQAKTPLQRLQTPVRAPKSPWSEKVLKLATGKTPTTPGRAIKFNDNAPTPLKFASPTSPFADFALGKKRTRGQMATPNTARPMRKRAFILLSTSQDNVSVSAADAQQSQSPRPLPPLELSPSTPKAPTPSPPPPPALAKPKSEDKPPQKQATFESTRQTLSRPQTPKDSSPSPISFFPLRSSTPTMRSQSPFFDRNSPAPFGSGSPRTVFPSPLEIYADPDVGDPDSPLFGENEKPPLENQICDLLRTFLLREDQFKAPRPLHKQGSRTNMPKDRISSSGTQLSPTPRARSSSLTLVRTQSLLPVQQPKKVKLPPFSRQVSLISSALQSIGVFSAPLFGFEHHNDINPKTGAATTASNGNSNGKLHHVVLSSESQTKNFQSYVSTHSGDLERSDSMEMRQQDSLSLDLIAQDPVQQAKIAECKLPDELGVSILLVGTKVDIRDFGIQMVQDKITSIYPDMRPPLPPPKDLSTTDNPPHQPNKPTAANGQQKHILVRSWKALAKAMGLDSDPFTEQNLTLLEQELEMVSEREGLREVFRADYVPVVCGGPEASLPPPHQMEKINMFFNTVIQKRFFNGGSSGDQAADGSKLDNSAVSRYPSIVAAAAPTSSQGLRNRAKTPKISAFDSIQRSTSHRAKEAQ